MQRGRESLFEAFLRQHDDRAWAAGIERLLPRMHEVDRTALRIWSAFYPVGLNRMLRETVDRRAVARRLRLTGRYDLRDQIDTSHLFFFGHRFWNDARRAVLDFARAERAPASLDLNDLIDELSHQVAQSAHSDVGLVRGITAVALLTVQHAGVDAVRRSTGQVQASSQRLRRDPDAILRARARDDSQGLFGFLRGANRRYTVTWDERTPKATFTLINSQHITTAAQRDTRDHSPRDPRCFDGPIPVRCRSGACGTCWVGVLAGAEKLAPLANRERLRLREFGYVAANEPYPLIRLACQAQAFGNVTLVLPPWNGVFGKSIDAISTDGRQRLEPRT
ncbi:MAG: 2Fe-2S iron-sulfur cluster-binding protein [Vicinamibacterales bacterium]